MRSEEDDIDMEIEEGSGRAKKLPNAPVRPGFQRVVNQVLLEVNGALTILASRRLETRERAKKIAELRRFHLDDTIRIIRELEEQVYIEFPVPEGWEGTDLPVAINEQRQLALNEIYRDTSDILAIPKSRLITDSDLPKLLKGDLGDKNQLGVSDIMRNLHFLYPMQNDPRIPETVEDGEDGGDTFHADVEEGGSNG